MKEVNLSFEEDDKEKANEKFCYADKFILLEEAFFGCIKSSDTKHLYLQTRQFLSLARRNSTMISSFSERKQFDKIKGTFCQHLYILQNITIEHPDVT
ncbi:hypothetical protein TNCT_394641 [Trichonephila clavata]|uniref:Uncharacterized protein n=1 Tax=Trichonephila clavata TaxID=2740835 RepID=A0A8X6L468_TRICU|nr:hypothetical protein TNCT_394641 [Trichonephila clavata]